MDGGLIYVSLHLLHLYALGVEIYPILRAVMHRQRTLLTLYLSGGFAMLRNSISTRTG